MPKPPKKTAGTKPKKKRTPSRDLAQEKADFVRDTLTRAEAAPLDDKGCLPPGATHAIVKPGKKKALPKIERVRFSAF